MSEAIIRQIDIKPDGVYLNIKMSNDGIPFRTLKNHYLTDFYNIEGQQGLDREIVRSFCENARMKGNHPSIMRYRPCMEAAKQHHQGYVDTLNAEYSKLSNDDVLTQWFGEKRQTEGMRAYKRFQAEESHKYYTMLASQADPVGTKYPKENADRFIR